MVAETREALPRDSISWAWKGHCPHDLPTIWLPAQDNVNQPANIDGGKGHGSPPLDEIATVRQWLQSESQVFFRDESLERSPKPKWSALNLWAIHIRIIALCEYVCI